jgi:hypothetical protein
MSSINFNDLYKNNDNKILSYKHYFYYYFQNYSLISIIVILFLLLILLYFYKLLNKYNIIIISLLIIIFIVLYFINNYINRTKKCFLLSNEIIKNNNIKPIETKTYLLDKPFREFYVNSSHNSFIPCNQNLDISSLDSIKKVLLMGARSIELDIHEKNNKPVVAHGTKKNLTTTYLPFEDCIDIIVKYGFQTSDPLVLFIDIITKNDIVLKKISEIIKLKLGDRLLSKEFKIGNWQKQFIDEPIKNLLNKIIIVSTYGVRTNLRDIFDNVTDDKILKNSGYFVNIINSNNKIIDDNNNNNNNIMKRKYPYGDIWSHFSYNYDPVVHWKNKVNFVSLNFQTFDDALFKNYIMFKDYSIVHFSEISFN